MKAKLVAGEPKIVNNATEDGENHVTPQACN